MKPELIKPLVTPLVRFCLRHALSFQFLLDCCRDVFLRESILALRARGEEPNVSRLSAMTGLNRRQVTAALNLAETEMIPKETLIARVIGRWKHDKKYSSGNKPRVLQAEGAGSQFQELVSSVSRDLNPYTVLKELERTGNVKRIGKGVALVSAAFVPRANTAAGFRLLGEDLEELVDTVEENVTMDEKIPNLHLRTEYTRIRKEKSSEVKQWLLDEGSKFHERVRKYLSQLDLDVNPAQRTGSKSSGNSVRVVLGTFGRVSSKGEES